jgi:hypothetical protein
MMAKKGSKAGNVKKAARANTTAAARRGYSRPRKANAATAPEGDTSPAAAARAGAAAGAASAAATTGRRGKAARDAGHPDYPPPAAIDHSAQATDTPPPQLDTKINKDGSRSEK